MSVREVRRIRNREYRTLSDGTEWTRKVATAADALPAPWTRVPSQLKPEYEESPLLLYLVLEPQSEGEPKHWYFFAAREGQPGNSYQVTGDATFMHYNFCKEVQPPLEATTFVIGCLGSGDEDTLLRCAESEAPPSAPTRADVKENCQGWTIRVMERLRAEGIVDGKWITSAKGLQEPV